MSRHSFNEQIGIHVSISHTIKRLASHQGNCLTRQMPPKWRTAACELDASLTPPNWSKVPGTQPEAPKHLPGWPRGKAEAPARYLNKGSTTSRRNEAFFISLFQDCYII